MFVTVASLTLAGVAVDHIRGGPDLLPDAVGAMHPAFVDQPGWSLGTLHVGHDNPLLYVWRNDGLQPTATTVEWSAWSKPLTMQAMLFMRGPGGAGRPGGGQWEEGQRIGRTAERLAAPLADDVAVWSTNCLAGADVCGTYLATLRYGRSIVQIGVGGIKSDQRLSYAQFDSYLNDVVVQMNRLAGR